MAEYVGGKVGGGGVGECKVGGAWLCSLEVRLVGRG